MNSKLTISLPLRETRFPCKPLPSDCQISGQVTFFFRNPWMFTMLDDFSKLFDTISFCRWELQIYKIVNWHTSQYSRKINGNILLTCYRHCVLVIRVPGYRFKGPGFESKRCRILWDIVCWAGSTQIGENKWGATWKKKWQPQTRKLRLTTIGIR
jgi:hypothetical protein